MAEGRPWYDQDVFWETVGPLLFSRRRLEQTPGEVDQIVALLGVGPGARVLDLCCGGGRHSLELARRGFLVTGVDRTRAYLDRAVERARAEGLTVEFVEADMREFCRPESFDGAINFFTSFGYFEDPADDRRVVDNVFRSLKPGGVFLLEMMGKEVLARIFRERDWYEQEGMIVLEERKVTRNWGWMENRWILLKDGQRTDLTVSHRPYSAVELTSLLAGSGFEVTAVHGDVAGSPYDHQARRLVVLARRP